MWAMMEKLRMFFINKTQNQKERHTAQAADHARQYEKSAPSGRFAVPGERLHQAGESKLHILPDFRSESPVSRWMIPQLPARAVWAS
jgi:hypothetical protein